MGNYRSIVHVTAFFMVQERNNLTQLERGLKMKVNIQMKHKKGMIIIISIVGFIALLLVIGKINFAIRFNSQVKRIFSQSGKNSNPPFSEKKLKGLPEPVQRYFKHVLKEGQQIISYVRLTHDGQFKSGVDKKWMNITGEQYFSTEKPGYIWKGTTAMFTARDFYISDRGGLIATLFSLFNVVDASGGSFDQGELLRWLAESVWFPTNLLPSERLQWTPIDANSASLTFKYKTLSLPFLIRFNELGEIVEMETKRYMDESRLETWVCKANNYQLINNIKVPVECEAMWRLQTSDVSYAKFRVTKIEYDKPFRF